MIQLFDIKKAKKDLKTSDSEILKKYLDFSTKTIDEVFSICESSEVGLNESKVRSRLLKYGKNVVVKEDNKSPLYFLFMSFKDEFIIILLVLALINFLLGDKKI